jgi:hypothetical protein
MTFGLEPKSPSGNDDLGSVSELNQGGCELGGYDASAVCTPYRIAFNAAQFGTGEPVTEIDVAHQSWLRSLM